MIEHRHYVAAPGLVIRDPRSKARIPHEEPGIYVERTSFWIRRELAGDVINITPGAKPELAKRQKGAED